MGWTISFRIHADRQWTEDDLRKLRVHMDEWNARLSPISEAYDLTTLPTSADWRGFLKPSPNARGASDYVAVIQALRELEQLFGARATVRDEYFLREPTSPFAVDTAALAKRIRGGYAEADSDDVDALEQELEAEEASPDAAHPREPRVRPRRPDEDGDPRQLLTQVRSKLAQARADFEIWKRAQEKKKGSPK